jgi:hypothetical protein
MELGAQLLKKSCPIECKKGLRKEVPDEIENPKGLDNIVGKYNTIFHDLPQGLSPKQS